jgi:hypothetical protein
VAEILASYALCSLADAKAYADLDEEIAEHDELLIRLINTGSTMMHRVSGRTFVGTPGVRNYEVPAGALSFRIDDCTEVNGVALYADGSTVAPLVSTWTSAQFAAWPYSRPNPWDTIRRIQILNGSAGAGGIARVDADWGFEEIPEDVREAVIQHVALAYARNVQRFSGVINLETGRVEIPRSLAASSRDVALRYKARGV